jgi:transposase, IS5 family
MSFCISGLQSQIFEDTKVSVEVSKDHPLIKLSNVINWTYLMNLVLPDLKRTTPKLKWWLGRKLKLRTHLAVYILQQLFNMKDRETEAAIKENGVYRVFCGETIVETWHSPDHTKIESFRSRLSPETQNLIANETAVLAVKLGFADPGDTDFDSTVQEANIAYPSDLNLLLKLGKKAYKVAKHLNKNIKGNLIGPIVVHYKEMKSTVRKYFFFKLDRKNPKHSKAERHMIFQSLWTMICNEVRPVADIIKKITENELSNMPWNIKRDIEVIIKHAYDYPFSLIPYVFGRRHVKDKPLSFHALDVACFNKGKAGNKLQFGRAFQLGRISGNFLFAAKCSSIKMPDAESLNIMINTHQKLFGKGTLKSGTTDKGYYSKGNENTFIELKLNPLGLQKPGIKALTDEEKKIETALANRRAGIEPLIGHAKHGGQLRKSRMKSDCTTESAGYCAIMGFNFRQIVRNLGNEVKEMPWQTV